MTHRAYAPKRHFLTPWWIRKALYTLVGLAALVATAFDFASLEQVEQWTEMADKIIPQVTLFIVGAMAARNTSRISDRPELSVYGQPITDGYGPYHGGHDAH